jgi:cell division transport system ATP-binding protein
MPIIRLEQATKFYKWERKRHAAVSEIDLTIEQGEFVFVVGSSGAGKSTLLKLITGGVRPDRGAVYLDRLNLSHVPPWYWPKLRRTFGQVHQEVSLMRRRTIRENLSMVAKVGLSSQKQQVNEKVKKALGIVGMAGVENKYPGELSIGECRRVDLARALINSPPILVLDELTANLDEDTNWDLVHLLTEINRQGTTIVMATHASSFVNMMRRRVVTLVDGKIAGDVKRGRYGDITEKKKF